MNPDPSKLRQQHRQEEVVREAQNTAREFSSVEEMIRYDRQETPVPPAVAERLTEAIATEPKQGRPWWKRLFG